MGPGNRLGNPQRAGAHPSAGQLRQPQRDIEEVRPRVPSSSPRGGPPPGALPTESKSEPVPPPGVLPIGARPRPSHETSRPSAPSATARLPSMTEGAASPTAAKRSGVIGDGGAGRESCSGPKGNPSGQGFLHSQELRRSRVWLLIGSELVSEPLRDGPVGEIARVPQATPLGMRH